MAFETEFDPEAVKDLKKLDRPVQQHILAFLKLRPTIVPDAGPRSGRGQALKADLRFRASARAACGPRA